MPGFRTVLTLSCLLAWLQAQLSAVRSVPSGEGRFTCCQWPLQAVHGLWQQVVDGLAAADAEAAAKAGAAQAAGAAPSRQASGIARHA